MLSKGAKNIGLTPESLFRACDDGGKGEIDVDSFRIFLTKVKLGLSSVQAQRIAYLLDDSCSGVIRKEDYFQILEIYQQNSEKLVSGDRTYSQKSLIKFGEFLISKGYAAEGVFDKLDPEQKGFTTEA